MTDYSEKWPEMRMKHLELIQNAISRMGNNSASLKGYVMSIVAALVALAGATGNSKLAFLAVPIIIVFAALDASYLAYEKGFRSHYDSLRVRPIDAQPDFEVFTHAESIWSAAKSWSVWPFYISALGIACAVGCVL